HERRHSMDIPTRAATWPLILCAAFAPAAARGSEQASTQAATQTPEQELAALMERFHSAQEKFHADMRALRRGFDEEHATAEQKADYAKKSAELAKNDPGPQFVADFTALAERAKGSDVAAKAWLQVLQLSLRDELAPDSPANRALERLLADHLKS